MTIHEKINLRSYWKRNYLSVPCRASKVYEYKYTPIACQKPSKSNRKDDNL